MKMVFSLIAAGMLHLYACCQSADPLMEGKTLPSAFDKFILQGESPYMIFDFFSANCTVCFKKMPEVNNLQRRYVDKVRFILIGREDGKIKQVYEKIKSRLSLNLDAHYDSSVFRYYGIDIVPFYVWVNKSRVITAITGPQEVTEKNIELFLRDIPIDRKMNEATFDFNQPYLLRGNGGDENNFLQRSVLGVWTPGTRTYIPVKVDSQNDSSFQALGVSMEELYKYAFIGKAQWTFWDSLYGKVSTTVITDEPTGERYSYSIVRRSNHGKLLKELIRSDLDKYFGYDVEWKRMKMPCWKLIVDPARCHELMSDKGPAENSGSVTGFRLRNMHIKDLLYWIYAYHQNAAPFIDATGIQGTIDISIEALLTDLEEVRMELARKGLKLIKDEMDMDVLKLSRKKENVAVR